jgi:PAS domain S-box-containing protein
MAVFDPDTGRLLEVNDAWVKLYGWLREEALAMNVGDLDAEPDTRGAASIVPRGFVTRISVCWHRSKNGNTFPVELTSSRVMVDDREVTCAVMRDITQRRTAESALRRSAASFRAVIETMPDGVIVHRDGRTVYMNPSACRMLGYATSDDVVGVRILDIVHPDDRDRFTEGMATIVEVGSATPLFEQRLLRRDGASLVTEISSLPVEFEGEQCVLAIARDVTARKAIEAQLVMNDRLASLGRLAASVGHELNNPLAYVLGTVTLLRRELSCAALEPDVLERCADFLRTIEEGSQRMRHIVHDLKTLARADAGAHVLIDVQQILDVCANMAEQEVSTRARLVKDYEGPSFVRAIEARLGQVFLNLLVNAAQAIEPGDAQGNEVRIEVRNEGSMVVIEISDTGIGLSPVHQDRIFEPFFTTKEGVGTGLGLSISHGIVTGLGGTLTAHSRVDRGSTFRVVLPTADDDVVRLGREVKED